MIQRYNMKRVLNRIIALLDNSPRRNFASIEEKMAGLNESEESKCREKTENTTYRVFRIGERQLISTYRYLTQKI